MKFERNSPCPCGSGKKYKKCCLSSKTPIVFSPFIGYDPIELIKTFSLLQSVPENHGKYIRIEKAIADVVLSLITKPTPLSGYKVYNFSDILSKLNKHYPKDLGEDPPESSFVENLMFKNGNNNVFPGVLERGTQVVQTLLDTINIFDKELPQGFLVEINKGVSFILTIHNYICASLGYKRYEFKDRTNDNLHLDFHSIENRNLFEFTDGFIERLKNELGIDYDVEQEFITNVSDYKFNRNDLNSNELLFKPFIKIGDSLFLTMPSAELIVINNFIIEKAKKFKCYDKLFEVYKELTFADFLQTLGTIGFSLTNIIKEENEAYKPPFINVLHFDRNKFAIVAILEGKDMHLQFPQKELKQAIDKIKKLDPSYKIHLIGIHANISVMSGSTLALSKMKGVDETTILSLADLKGIITLWKCDHLTLWKFEKNRSRIQDKLTLSPFFSILTYFNWYEKNHGSFFHPDEFYDHITFDFKDQADLIRQVNLNLDLHMVDVIEDDKVFQIPVKRKEKSLPIYTPVQSYYSKVHTLLELYDLPIWVVYSKEYETLGEGFSGSITYWLIEMKESLTHKLELLGVDPVSINLDFDSRFFSKENNIKSEESDLIYSANGARRSISIHIPFKFMDIVLESDQVNYAERLLMGCVLTGLNQLIYFEAEKTVFSEIELGNYVISILNDPLKRMISPLKQGSEIKYHNAATIKHRYLQDSDISFIRENILKWAGIEQLALTDKKQKTEFCNKMVQILIEKFQTTVKNFDCLELLNLVIYRHDSAVYYMSHIDMSLRPKIHCFMKYEDIISDYRKERKTSVPSMLAYRCLVEFIVAEPPSGNQTVNNDDVDFLHALVEQVISFGNLSDVIKEGFSDMELDILPSGRIGMDHSFFDNELNDLSTSMIDNDIAKMVGDHSESAEKTENTVENKESKIDSVFIKDWGIGLYQISEICTFLSMYAILKLGKSFVILKEAEFFDLFIDSPYTKDEIIAFCDKMALTSRGRISSSPQGYRREDIYPWRYNRQLSYIRKPLIKLNLDEESLFLWSPRHMEMAEENLLSMFHNGTLKTDNSHKGIQSLLAKQNAIKGKKFQNKVHNWLRANTNLTLIPYEVKIAPKGAIKSSENLGDIDIMAFDKQTKKILLLELKNTKQAKVTYEFKRDIENYLSDLIPKHDRRVNWLEQHKERINSLIDFDITDYNIYSAIIASSTLPVKYLVNPPIPIFSFEELKSGGESIFN